MKYNVAISYDYFPKKTRPFLTEFYKAWTIDAESRREAAEKIWAKYGDELLAEMGPRLTKLPRKVGLHVNAPEMGTASGNIVRLSPVPVYVGESKGEQMDAKELAESVITGGTSLEEASGWYRDCNNENRHYGERYHPVVEAKQYVVRVFKTGEGFSIESMDGKYAILPGDAGELTMTLSSIDAGWPTYSPHKTWGIDHVPQLADTGTEVIVAVKMDKFMKKARPIGVKAKK